MAIRVPVGPTVDPSTRPLSPSTPEGVFGVAGDILSATGKTAQGISDQFAEHAEKMAAIDNRVAADGAVIKGAEAADQFMLDFKANNQGMGASQNLTSAYKRLEDIRNEAGAGLMSPAARDLYNSQSRIAGLQARQHLAGFAASERLTYLNQEADSGIKLTSRSLTAENFDQGLEALRARVDLKGDINGWGPEMRAQAVADATGDASYSVATGLAVNDPAKAQTFFDSHQQYMTPAQRTAAENVIKSSTQNFAVMNTVDAAVAANSIGGPAAYRAAIAGIESAGSGGYKAIGPTTKSGDRAYGKYQVMGANIPKWTEEVLGKRMTPQQFLADTAAQDKVFDAKFGSYVQRYGSPQEAASVWFTGRPQAQGAAMRDVNGMTGAQYVAKFSGGLGTESAGERLVNTLPQQIAQFNATIADPVLRERTVTEYIQRVSRQRGIETAGLVEAQNNLLQAALANNITDIAKLQGAYPGAMEDLAVLQRNPKSFIAFQNSLTARGNANTPERDAKFHELLGMQINDPQKFLLINPAEEDLTRTQRERIFNTQLAIRKKAASDTFVSQSVNWALGDEMVKQGISSANLQPDTRDYNMFTGALGEEMARWAESHPGKKMSRDELHKITTPLLAKRVVSSPYYIPFTNIQVAPGTREVTPSVPKDAEDRIRAQIEPTIKRKLEDWEVGQLYQRGLNSGGR